MRRAVALTVVLLGLGAWIAGGALLADPPAEAQDAPISFGHTIDSESLPPVSGGRPVYIVAIGSDARPGVCEPVEACLADSLHLIGVNPRKNAASILGFPRDSYVEIPGVGMHKINDALSLGGPEKVVETIEALTGVTVDYWVMTSFDGLPKMVEAIGGINVEIPYDMNDPSSGAVFSAGPATLTGKEALAFSRNRKGVPNGDFSRSENQGLLMLSALIQLRKEVARDPFRLLSWIVAGFQNTQTSLSLQEIFDLMTAALAVNPKRVTNVVTPGGIGTAGSASIVTLGSEADAMFADIADDGLIEAPAGEE